MSIKREEEHWKLKQKLKSNSRVLELTRIIKKYPVQKEENQEMMVSLSKVNKMFQNGGSDLLCQILLRNQVMLREKKMTIRLNNVKVNGDLYKSSYNGKGRGKA